MASESSRQRYDKYKQATRPKVCPCCRSPHPPDVACKDLERSDAGYLLERKGDSNG